MATVESKPVSFVASLARFVEETITDLGDLALFTWQVLFWSVRRPVRGTLVPIFYQIGFLSMPVVAVTGMFIGMVLALQSYAQFAQLGLSTRIGTIISVAVVRELGPVLAATMLAGRVGSAMAAELATMRITEQIDALCCLGTNPIHYLVVPRVLACVLLIPLLTVLANFMGVSGGALVSIQLFGIEAHHYWQNSMGAVKLWDLFVGLLKPVFFGGAVAIISCHRGYYRNAGAEGVGHAATQAFVSSFIAILALDFFLGLFLNNVQDLLWPGSGSRLLS
jgi:phospholipid/cholesterol/gamma-HCH transport system permease protein